MGSKPFDLNKHHKAHLEPLWRRARFVLRITEWKNYPPPVLAIKERQESAEADKDTGTVKPPSTFPTKAHGKLVERGHIVGESQRRCLPVFRAILARVRDDAGIPLELQRYLTQDGLRLRLNLPLDEEAGAKLALICRLQERLADLDRVELIARRVADCTREEAVYLLSRITGAGQDGNRWAVMGLRILLGGQSKDGGVQRMLDRLR